MKRKVSGMAVVERWMDRGDEDAAASQAVEDGIGSAADSEFTQAVLAGRVAKAGLKAERLNESDDTHGEPLGGTRLVECDVRAISRSRAVARGDRTNSRRSGFFEVRPGVTAFRRGVCRKRIWAEGVRVSFPRKAAKPSCLRGKCND
jgi:hypothetical protein